MPSEPPPKYIEIIDAMRTRIDRDLYRVGDKLPSEAQLVREFGTSRSTVVRALEFLRQEGWIQGVQGRGRIVLQRTAPVLSRAPERVDRLLRPETYAVLTLLDVEPVRLGRRLASALALPAGSQAVMRRRLVTREDRIPIMVSTAYVPAELAAGTELNAPVLLPEGLLGHLRQRRTAVPRRVVERFTARQSSPRETTVLRLDRRACLPAVLLVALDQIDRPLFAVESLVSSAYDDFTATFALA